MLAAVVNIFLPGLGQLFQGRLFPAIGWLLIVIFGYCLFVFPGIVMHLLCIVDAAQYSHRRMVSDALRSTRRS